MRLDSRLRAWLTRGNPVAWKESLLLNTAWSRNLYYMVAAILVGGEVAFLHGLRNGWWDAVIDLWYLAGCVTLVAGLAAIQGAASMVFEKSQGTFDLLRVTRLTPSEIARGKVLGTLLGTGFLLLLPLGHLAISTLAGSRDLGSGNLATGYHSLSAAMAGTTRSTASPGACSPAPPGSRSPAPAPSSRSASLRASSSARSRSSSWASRWSRSRPRPTSSR
jgi:hypothetical protein